MASQVLGLQAASTPGWLLCELWDLDARLHIPMSHFPSLVNTEFLRTDPYIQIFRTFWHEIGHNILAASESLQLLWRSLVCSQLLFLPWLLSPALPGNFSVLSLSLDGPPCFGGLPARMIRTLPTLPLSFCCSPLGFKVLRGFL